MSVTPTSSQAEVTKDEVSLAHPTRGFAAMQIDRQREIASLGGRTAHERGVAHQFSSEEARRAGRKGGVAVSQNREYMAALGRRGVAARRGKSTLGQSAST